MCKINYLSYIMLLDQHLYEYSKDIFAISINLIALANDIFLTLLKNYML